MAEHSAEVQDMLHNSIVPGITGVVLQHCTKMNHAIAILELVDAKLGARFMINSCDYAENALMIALQYAPEEQRVAIINVLPSVRERRAEAQRTLALA
jgi:hypothetical protein